MKSIIVILALAAFAVGTHAVETDDVPPARLTWQQQSQQQQQQSSTATATVSDVQASTQSSSSVSIDNGQRHVGTAYGAPVTPSNGTCMGGSSVGGQGVTFGVSFSTTWTDEACQARYDAAYLDSLGLRKAAIERLCRRADIAAAMKAAGTLCTRDKTAQQELVSYSYTDPYIRSRLGLPQLAQ